MEDIPSLTEYYPPMDTTEERVVDALRTIREQLSNNEWRCEPSNDACYTLYVRGNLRVRLNTVLKTIAFESVKTNRHLVLKIDVQHRKDLYDAFSRYSPPVYVPDRDGADLDEWLTCVHENQYGREVYQEY